MRILSRRNCLVEIGILILLSLGVCGTGLADDDAKPSRASATSAPKPAPNSPVPGLTEREQWLLNRVEQLEKRVEELEAKEHAGSPGATPAPSNATKEVAAGGPAGNSVGGLVIPLLAATTVAESRALDLPPA